MDGSGRVLVVGLTCFLASAAPVSAETFTVNSTADAVDAAPGDGVCATATGDCTLRAAIQEANALGGADQIILPAGTYALTIPGQNEDDAATGDLDIRSDLTIVGGGSALTIIDGNALDRVLHILPPRFVEITVTISGVTIQNGAPITPGFFTGNGGGIFHAANDALATVRLVNSSVTNNANGGIESRGILTLDHSRVSNNTGGVGAGIHQFGCSTSLTVTDSIISGNTADSVGGGLSSECGTAAVTNSTISDNTAGFHAGGIDSRGTLTLSDSTVSGNVAMNGFGGGIRAAGTETIIRTTISGNRASRGGGISVEQSDSLTTVNSTISGNTAAAFGGGIAWNGDQVLTTSLRSVTVANNQSGTGAGLVNPGAGTGGGLAAINKHGIVNIGNSIVAGNRDAVGSSPDCVGSAGVLDGGLTSQGHNLIQDPTGCIVTGDTTGNILGLDARLGPLTTNGGPTQTHGLLTGSPALDAGDNSTCEATDQRGVARPVHAVCDIGAFEGVLQTLSIPTLPSILNQLGVFSSDSFEAAGGPGPYSWSVIGGTLPVGMALSARGVLSGTPTETGRFTFTVRVTDSAGGTAEQTFVEEVLLIPPPQVRVRKVGTAAVAGREIDYFILVTNTSNRDARDVSVVEFLQPWSHIAFADPVPVGVTMTDLPVIGAEQALPVDRSVTWNIPVLPAGGMTIIRYRTRLNNHVTEGLEVRGGEVCAIPGGNDCDRDFVDEMKQSLQLCRPLCRAFGDINALLAVPNLAQGLGLTSEADRAAFVSGKLGGAAADTARGVSFNPEANCDDCIKHTEFAARLRRQTCLGVLKGTGDCNFFGDRASRPVDPNEKVVIAHRFIQPDQPLVYPIHFENIGSVEALDVFVTDVLDPSLDASTVEFLTPGGTFNVATRTARWDLLGINLPPGKTDNVLLSVKPLPGLPSGTEIRNRAVIQFEALDTMTTNDVVNIIDTTPPTCRMDLLPMVTRTVTFPLSWSGSDTIGEIRYYTIFMSIDGGGFTPLLNNTSVTSGTVDGQMGKQYGFICVATDTAGNVEVQSLTAEATTTVVNDATPPVITPDVPLPNAGGWYAGAVTITWAVSDAESGIASSTGCGRITLTEETAGQVVTCSVTNGVGLTTSASVEVKIDRTPPRVVFGSPAPQPNVAGWNNSPVAMTFIAADDLSGVSSVSPASPLLLAAEGAGVTGRVALTDTAGNTVTYVSPPVNIDRTPPEASVEFDPVARDLAVRGQDALSGVPNDVAFSTTTETDWRRRGEQVCSRHRPGLRTYHVADRAGNRLVLVIDVEPHGARDDERGGHGIAGRIVSVKVGSEPPQAVADNRFAFTWTNRENGSLNRVTQHLQLRARHGWQQVVAQFDAKSGLTRITQNNGGPAHTEIHAGLALLRLVAGTRGLSIEF